MTFLNSETIRQKIKEYTEKYNLQEAYKFFDKARDEKDFPILGFCRELGINVYHLSKDLEEKYDGYLTRDDSSGKYEIFLNTGVYSERQRFTLAHELGHIIYEHKFLKNIDSKGDKTVESLPWGAEYLMRDISFISIEEKEANDFAANILIRSDLLKEDVEAINKEHITTTLLKKQDIIREKYNVSFSFLRYRMENLKLKVNP